MFFVIVFIGLNSNAQTQKLDPKSETYLFSKLAAWLTVNAQYSNQYRKAYVLAPYINSGCVYMWQVREKINELPSNENSRNIFLDYLYDTCLSYGKDAIIDVLVSGRMTIEDAKNLIEYVQTKHKLNMQQRGKL